MYYEVGYGKPPRHTRFKKGEPSANPRGRPAKNLAALLVEGLNKPVVVTEDGQRRTITVREAIVTQLINKSATADLRATKMLLDMIKDAEKQAATAAAPEPAPRFTAADEEVVDQLIERLRHQILSEMAASGTNPKQTAVEWAREQLEQQRFHHRDTESMEKVPASPSTY
jgi:hypothetical protein